MQLSKQVFSDYKQALSPTHSGFAANERKCFAKVFLVHVPKGDMGMAYLYFFLLWFMLCSVVEVNKGFSRVIFGFCIKNYVIGLSPSDC